MPSFAEERLNTEIRYGSSGGPEFNTEVVIMDSGAEGRNSNWQDARGKWVLAADIYDDAEKEALLAFFRARRGRAEGFRFKDWTDYLVTVANGIMSPASVNGAKEYQLVRRYSTTGTNHDRPIKKPVSGTVSVYMADALQGSATVDPTTGLVTLPVLTTLSITGITKANPGVITISGSHGLTGGDKVWLSGIVGMTELNGVQVTITSTGASAFSIAVNTTNYTTYSSAGTVKKYPQTGGTLTWKGEFDVPVRFDTDSFKADFIGHDQTTKQSMFNITGLPLVELRL